MSKQTLSKAEIEAKLTAAFNDWADKQNMPIAKAARPWYWECWFDGAKAMRDIILGTK